MSSKVSRDTYQKPSTTVAIHVAVWILYTSYEILILFFAQEEVNLWEAFPNLTINAGLFYLNALVLLPLFFAKRHYLRYLGSLLVLLGMFVAIKYVLKIYVVLLIDQDLAYPYTSFQAFMAQAIWRGSHFTILSFGYWFAIRMIRSEREKRKLEQQERKNLQQLHAAEKNLRETEIAYLKNQINPHFLFNTLNFFYEQIQPHSEIAAKGILILSGIMRYALKENDINAKAMLSEEVEHLENYIAINQMRFSHRLQVNLDIQGDLRFRMIIPLVLITFVENCFKHGDLFDPKNPLLITIKVDDDQLFFCTNNHKKSGPVEHSSGIGLTNTVKRLDIIYGCRYTLNIDDTLKSYATRLIIKL